MIQVKVKFSKKVKLEVEELFMVKKGLNFKLFYDGGAY